MSQVERPTGQESPNIIPRLVATPLPPLNFNHTGKLWPNRAKSPEMIASLSPNSLIDNKVAKVPFPQSSNNVLIANSLLPVRNTFVAPIFCEPIFRISPNPAA